MNGDWGVPHTGTPSVMAVKALLCFHANITGTTTRTFLRKHKNMPGVSASQYTQWAGG